MRKLTVIAVTAATAVLGLLPASALDNPLRDRVRAWEQRAMEQALGADYVARLGPRPEIVGGTQAPAGKWPFQVALLDSKTANNYYAQFCGGTLVSALFVVTAAHCVYGTAASRIDVLTNTQSLSSGGVRHKIAAIRMHPNYNDNTTDFDIAVIKLQTPASGITKFAQLLSAANENTLAPVGELTFVTGWGSRNANGGSYPTSLYQVQVPIVSRTDCNDANSYAGAITQRMICAGYTQGGKDSCDGDSGGPLTVQDNAGDYRILAGIVSWGDGCAQKNLFGVYSRVAVLSKWANNTIAALGGP